MNNRKSNFQFNLGDTVVIRGDSNDEPGKVIGRAEYTNASNNYLLRYANGQGIAVEQWWSEDALNPLP